MVINPNPNGRVNGVATTVDQYGNWWAASVPILGRGTATFDAVASASGGGAVVGASDFQTNAIVGFVILDPVQDIPGKVKLRAKQAASTTEIQITP